MRSLALLLAAGLAACGDLDVKSIRSPASAAVWQGEWTGMWQSAGAGSGSVRVRVQSFRDEPLVAVEFSNPCFVTRPYELVLSPTVIELRADGVTVLAATLDDGPRMVGTFDCTTDAGLWEATRIGDLPEVGDLAGVWTGTLQYVSGAATIGLVLAQEAQDGVLRLTGELDLGSLWPVGVPVVGRVDFRADGFDVVLRSAVGVTPDVLLSGVGDVDPLRIELGLVQSITPGALPFTQAVFSVAHTPE